MVKGLKLAHEVYMICALFYVHKVCLFLVPADRNSGVLLLV